MTLTLVTVTGTFADADSGVPLAVKVTATLSEPIQNGTTIIEPEPVIGQGNGSGHLVASDDISPYQLYANDDAATSPPGTHYEFLIEVENTPLRRGAASIPHTAGTIDLTTLLPL